MASDRQSQPRGAGGRAGRGTGEDSSNQPGQYPGSLFGMPLPAGTGAGGTPGGGNEDSVSQTGQYTSRESISGVDLPQAGSGDATQPPGSSGRMAGDQAVTGPAKFTNPGSAIFAETVEDHQLENAPSRPDGMYPSTTKLPSEREPSGTGAGGGTPRGPSHPNAGR